MKKIGLVTWYDRGPNYGTTLQAFALQNYIKSLNYDCFIIKYDEKNIYKKIKFCLIEIYFYIFKRQTYYKRKKMFNWINKNIILTNKKYSYNSIKKIEKDFDSFVCGSDQIWSTAENIIDPFYYLQFTNLKKRISYAPSIGKNRIGEKVKNEFIKYISGFDYLSIREETGSQIIEQLIGKKPIVVADPTLLFNKEEWINLLKIKKSTNNKQIIFAYFLSKNKEYFNIIVEFAKKNNLILHTTVENYNNFGNSIVMNSKDFLEEILNANFIVTDSFHGMIFSLIFKKNFAVFKRFKDNESMNQNSRVIDFLKRIKLNSRIYNNNIDLLFQEKIEYSKISPNIDNIIKESQEYLQKSLYESVNKNKLR